MLPFRASAVGAVDTIFCTTALLLIDLLKTFKPRQISMPLNVACNMITPFRAEEEL